MPKNKLRHHSPKLPSHQAVPNKPNIFCQLSFAMVTSEAWHELKETAARLLIGMETERYYHGLKPPHVEEPEAGFTLQDFYFPQNYAAIVYGITSKRGYSDGIADLVEKGFISITRQGCRAGNLSGSSHKLKSVYRFSEDWKNWRKD